MPDINELIEKYKNWDSKYKSLITLIVLIFITFLFITGTTAGLLPLFILVLVPIYMKRMKLKDEMQKNFKENDLQKILQEAFPGATYDSEGSAIDAEGCRRCNLFPIKKNMCLTEDGVQMRFGRNDDISLDYVEVYTYEIKSDSDGAHYKSTLFKGGLFKYTFFKKFKDNIYIIPNEVVNGKVKHGLLGGDKPVHNPTKLEKNLTEVSLEDVEFNELFSVYSNNEAETFYILTPQYMSLIKELYRKYGSNIRFKFSDNYMYIAINDMDLFDFKPVFDKLCQVDHAKSFDACVAQTKEEIKSLVDFAEKLELGDSIFA